jgi:excisionase family DNA binding protein
MNILNKEFLNHQEAANYLNLKPATLYRYVVKGKVQLYKIDGGALNLYKKTDLDMMIQPVIKKRG